MSENYWSKDLTENLLERAATARAEGTGTAIGDALHFEKAAAEIDRLRIAMQEAIDLLLENRRGSPARSAAHNARICLQSALKAGISDNDQMFA